jgi:uncharacterized protein (UPF0335 family)
MERDTNIINDDVFLREIFNDVKTDAAPAEERTDIDNILLGEENVDPNKPNPNDTPINSEEGGETDEERTQREANEQQIAEAEKASRSRFGVKDTINSLIENGVWEDMPIKYGDKVYENISDLLDKEKSSKELFDLLSVAQKKHREDQIKENYVKVGDKDSIKAKLVNAILHDVEYRDLLEYNESVVKPLQKIDFTTIQDGDRIAEAFVRQCLIEIDNYHPDSIDAVVEKLKTDFRILEKAEAYQKVTIDNFNREIEKRELEKVEVDKAQAEELKKEVKSLKEELKNQGVDDKFANQILKLRFTKDDKGKFHYENHIAEKIKADKGFEARLMHFVLNEEDFIGKAGSKVKTDTSVKFLELINAAPKEAGSKVTPKPTNLHIDDEDLFAELGLLK